jgi:hypothetical protein
MSDDGTYEEGNAAKDDNFSLERVCGAEPGQGGVMPLAWPGVRSMTTPSEYDAMPPPVPPEAKGGTTVVCVRLTRVYSPAALRR